MTISPDNLRQVVAFRNATDEDARGILQASSFRQIEEGEYFFLQGDVPTHAYVLTEGQVKLLQSNPQGQVVNLRTVHPWQLFGALGAVRHIDAYPASAQALQDSGALAIPSDFLHGLLTRRPELSMDMMQLMTSYIQEMQARYMELATERVEQRICRAVLRLATHAANKVDGGIELALTREDLAQISGTTLFTVSRVLADWHRRGFVETGRERLRILKPHELVRIAEGLP